MDALEESNLRYNALKTSERIALICYALKLEKGEPEKGLFDFINTIQDRSSVFDVPTVTLKDDE
jgi:hypothetical protein